MFIVLFKILFLCQSMSAVEISIVVPSYNGSRYLLALKEGICNQGVENFECILVDDGSTDDTRLVFSKITDTRFKYYYQPNAGVSAARNNGLKQALGKFILFFDVDDSMPPDFLRSRISALMTNQTIDFVSGPVSKVTEGKSIGTGFRGTGKDGIEEILLYMQDVVTCPSNYLFRADFLRVNHLTFNTRLSSTADRYFLIECYQRGNGICNGNITPLHYNVHQGSMSATLTPELVKDNEVFYSELSSHALIPSGIYKKSLLLGMFILAASHFKIRQLKPAIVYGVKGFWVSPLKFIGLLVKRKF